MEREEGASKGMNPVSGSSPVLHHSWKTPNSDALISFTNSVSALITSPQVYHSGHK